MKRYILIAAVIIAPSMTNAIAGFSQGQSNQVDPVVDAKTRTKIIEGVLTHLRDYYVFPDIAKKMETSIRERLRLNAYDGTTSASALADLLTSQLREVSRDNHLRVTYSPDPLPVLIEGEGETPQQIEGRRRSSESRKYGFDRVERLHGNIGYLSLSYFERPDWAGDIATAAMNFLANTDALIVDLRGNGGGQPEMSILLASYLFDRPMHVVNFYTRTSHDPRQFWTQPYVVGKRYVGKDVYVLTSERTFSAAEGFAYNLKAMGRITIIGEKTHGGANPGSTHRINDHFKIFVPDGRAVNPVTKTNWGATGVIPDENEPALIALQRAHLMALNKLLSKNPDDALSGERKRIVESLQKHLDQVKKN